MSDTPPDIILSDVVMPVMTGPELAEQLALIEPDVPLLFMSGYVDDHFLSDAFELRPELLIRKPFTAARLRTRVRAVLDSRPASVTRD